MGPLLERYTPGLYLSFHVINQDAEARTSLVLCQHLPPGVKGGSRSDAESS